MVLLTPFKRGLVLCLILTILCLITIGSGRAPKQNSEGPATTIKKMEPNQKIEVTAHYGKSLRGRIGSIPVLVLRGSYEEMGEAHGALAGKEIIHLLDKILIPYVNQKQTDAWDKELIPDARAYLFPERYERELDGIMLGIKKQYPSVADRMLSSINRELSVDDLRVLNCFNELPYSKGRCSSFCAWGKFTQNGEVICGRNLDERPIPGKMPFMVIAREPTEPGRQACIEIFLPGFIGVSTPMNADGLIVMAHHERGLPSSTSQPWEPRAIVLRDVIESVRVTDSIDEIVRLFEHRPVRLGNSTHIALPLPSREHPSSPFPFVLEWDGNRLGGGVTVRIEDPIMAKDATICTNHFVKRRPEKSTRSGSSHRRFQHLLSLIRKFHASKEVIDVEKAMKMMDSVSQNGESFTYLSVIAIPRERKMIFSISPKSNVPATKGQWTEITWDQIFSDDAKGD